MPHLPKKPKGTQKQYCNKFNRLLDKKISQCFWVWASSSIEGRCCRGSENLLALTLQTCLEGCLYAVVWEGQKQWQTAPPESAAAAIPNTSPWLRPSEIAYSSLLSYLLVQTLVVSGLWPPCNFGSFSFQDESYNLGKRTREWLTHDFMVTDFSLWNYR